MNHYDWPLDDRRLDFVLCELDLYSFDKVS